jgi:cbb3-type cytochrome oxidase maturation protein
MSIIYILIPIAVLLTSIGIYLFFWAVRTEQFDDLEKQGMSILFDEKTNNESSDNHDDSNNDALNSDNSNSDNK